MSVLKCKTLVKIQTSLNVYKSPENQHLIPICTDMIPDPMNPSLSRTLWIVIRDSANYGGFSCMLSV